MKSTQLRQLVFTAIFAALILMLWYFGIGLIPLGFINVTVLCIPVIVGTLVLGLKSGLVLGFCFALTSILSAFGVYGSQSTFASMLLAKSPLLVIVMSLAPRLMIPVITHLTYQAFTRKKSSKLATAPAAIAGSLTNTVLYLGLMLLFFVLTGLDSAAVLALIGGTGLIAGGSEAAVAAILSTPVVMALSKVKK